MQKNILLPTDLTIESLNLLIHAIRNHEQAKLNAILLLGQRASDSIIDLLFASEKNKTSVIGSDFKNALEMVKNRNASQLQNVHIEFFNGVNRAAAYNFAEANRVDEIYLPREYKMNPTAQYCFDTTPLLRGLPIPTFEVSWATQDQMPEKNLPAELFLYVSK
jgi:hypothetical protein